MPSTTKNSVRFRCSQGRQGCGGYFRVSLKRLKRSPDVKCAHCGCDKVYFIESWRQKEMANRHTCRCNSYPFPHKAGALRFCIHHPDFDKPSTREEDYAYRSCLETPRSSNG